MPKKLSDYLGLYYIRSMLFYIIVIYLLVTLYGYFGSSMVFF